MLPDRNIVDIDTFTDFYMSEILSGLPDFKPLELDKDTYFLSGNPAYKLIYTLSPPTSVFSGGAAKTLEYGTVVGDKVYSVAYLAKPELYSDNLSLAEEMIDSFQIVTAQ